MVIVDQDEVPATDIGEVLDSMRAGSTAAHNSNPQAREFSLAMFCEPKQLTGESRGDCIGIIVA
jgi:hypothetical protein